MSENCDCGACGVTGDGLGYIWCASMNERMPGGNVKRERVRDMGPLERIDHAKQIRTEAKRRTRTERMRVPKEEK